MAEKRNSNQWFTGRRLAGVILLVIAAMALLSQLMVVPVGMAVPLIMAVVFIVAAGVTRKDGYLVPGGILTGVGVGLIAQLLAHQGRTFEQAIFFLCLAGGFALITVLNAAMFRRRVLWPLWPTAGVAVIGLMMFSRMNVEGFFTGMKSYWPVILVVIALWLMFGRPGKK